jgi:sulfoxide reductase heme-binding subunit YedZ
VLTWIILRAAGIGAYLVLWATVSWGLVGTTALMGRRVPRATAIAVHQFLATAAFVLLGVHIGGVLLDSFVKFKPLDVLIPMHSTFKAVPVAFGIFGMYALAVVLISSWMRKHVSTKVWRALHLLAVPAFALALVHGVFTGTDTVRPWMWWGYVITGTSVLFLMLTRTLTIGLRPERHAVPAGVRARTPRSAEAPVAARGGVPAPANPARNPTRPARAPAAPAPLPTTPTPASVPAVTVPPAPAPGDPAAPAVPVTVPISVPQPEPVAATTSDTQPLPSTIVIRLEVVMKDERGRDRGTQEIEVPVRLERFSLPPSRNGTRSAHLPPHE